MRFTRLFVVLLAYVLPLLLEVGALDVGPAVVALHLAAAVAQAEAVLEKKKNRTYIKLKLFKSNQRCCTKENKKCSGLIIITKAT